MTLRRVRQLGLFQGVQQADDVELPDELIPLAHPDREDPQLTDPRHDPLSDWLDEPFPEEMR